MSDDVDLQEFVGGFVTEADELIANANACLLEIETAIAAGESRPRAVRELFRALHTIKGLAGMIGIEAIVEVAHGLETLVRAADRAGGALSRHAIDVSLQGVAAIADRVRAVAEQRAPAAVPESLLAEISRASTTQDEPRASPPPTTSWDERLSPSERQQLALGLQAGRRAWAVTFTPSEAYAARGITIASVRAQLGELAEIVKVAPRATPGGASSVAFDLLVISDASQPALAGAASATVDDVVAVTPERPVEPAPEPSSRSPEVHEPAEPNVGGLGRSVVRVELAKLDALQEQLSLMIVAKFRLDREVAAQALLGHDVRRLREIADQQARIIRNLRRALLRARMVRVAEVLEPLSLLVRSLARTGGKQVRLVIEANDAEVDKTVADRLLPALIHLVRNAVDHAIESADERAARGKPSAGTVHVRCKEISGNRLQLVVSDDGRGIDRDAVGRRANRAIASDSELMEVLATPGFSTRDVVTRTSGRGLGMDIVKRIATVDLGGRISVRTERDVGTEFSLEIPVTIAVVEVFSFVCADQTFVVPVSAIDEIFDLAEDQTITAPVHSGVTLPVVLVRHRGRAVPVMPLCALLDIDGRSDRRKALLIHQDGEPVGFAVDRMLSRHEVVVRPLEDPLVRVPGITGATDLGDGRPTLLLDLHALGRASREKVLQ
ncbi:MAG: chemotaxis protein CheW [Kofleriaceae bacterium]